MRKITKLLTVMTLLLVLGIGCSDDPKTPIGPEPVPSGFAKYSDSLDAWVATLDGSSHEEFALFSLFDRNYFDSTATSESLGSGSWDIGFMRTAVILNGGRSSTGEDVEGTSLGAVSFVDVTIDDTTGANWMSDNVAYEIDEWYAYNPTTHSLDMTNYVYSMVDASGEHYLKFRIDSLSGVLGPPPEMGTVHISYYFQTEAGSTTLSGSIETAAIVVGSGVGYFDFSTGTQVDIEDSKNSLEWDLGFSNYNVMQNSGPNGIGSCASFQAFTELTDSTDIGAFTAQPAAPMFGDILSSALTDWYDYDHITNLLSSKGEVYLIKTSDSFFKLQIVSYYANVGGNAVSAYYTINFVQL